MSAAPSEIVDCYCTPGTERETALAPEALLKQMDAAGIARAVIAPEDREIAVNNATGNDRILRMAGRWPDRFIPACTVNPWSGRSGCDELRRAVRAGAKMLVLTPALQGFYLGDEVADELLHVAAGFRVPVYVHTGPHSAASPAQLLLLASRHPETGFILGHCGSTDHVYDMPMVIEAAPKNVWYEISLVRPSAVAKHGRAAGSARLIFGSSAPRHDPAFELKFLDRHWPIAEHPDTYGGNLLRLFSEMTP
jgi:uncharacterized protein